MRPTLVLDVVGLSPELLGDDTPHLNELVRAGVLRPLATVTPAVTCTVQSTLLTGRWRSNSRNVRSKRNTSRSLAARRVC